MIAIERIHVPNRVRLTEVKFKTQKSLQEQLKPYVTKYGPATVVEFKPTELTAVIQMMKHQG